MQTTPSRRRHIPVFAALAVLAWAPSAFADGAGDAMVAALEKRLLAAQAIRFQLDVKSDGANAAELRGEYDLRQGNRTWIRVAGSLRGAPAELQLKGNRDGLDGRIAGKPQAAVIEFRAAAPTHLTEAMLLRLVRIGALHDLANLGSGKPPEAAAGFDTRFQLRDVRTGTDKLLDGKIARPLTMTIVAGGKDIGKATLWLDLASGLPLRREQVVHFPEGDMNVVERYERFEASSR